MKIGRELSEQVSALGRKCSRPRPALGTLEKIAYRLLVGHTTNSEKVSVSLSRVAGLAKRYGVEDVNVLKLFYRLFENYPRGLPSGLVDSLICKINHYEEMNGHKPDLSRIEWFFSQFAAYRYSGNHGKRAPGSGEVARRMAFEGYDESKRREPRVPH